MRNKSDSAIGPSTRSSLLAIGMCLIVPILVSFFSFKFISCKTDISLADANDTESLTKELKDEDKKALEKFLSASLEKAKGDLVSQISIPIVSMIAAIFAAFAVKDIVAMLLNKQIMNELEEKLRQDIEDRLIPNAINSNLLTCRVNDLETYINFLEHEMSNIAIQHLFSIAHANSKSNSSEGTKLVIDNIQELYKLSRQSLDKMHLSKRISFEDLNQIIKLESILINSGLKYFKLEEPFKTTIGNEVEANYKANISSTTTNIDAKINIDELMDNVFRRQAILLISTISDLGDDDLTNLITRELFDYIKRKKENTKERGDHARVQNRSNPISPRRSRK